MWILAGIALLALLIIIQKWFSINSCTNVDTSAFAEKLLSLIKQNNLSDASMLCIAGRKKTLPRILGAGITKAQTVPELVRSAMEEESLHMIPFLEKRLPLIATFGNLATLLGLMGTIYGLILAFAAVAQPQVSPVEKSSLLAVGISAAMNTTLLGLVIAVPCVLAYSILRARVDEVIVEIDRYAVALIKALTPDDIVQKSYKVSDRRVREEVETEPNMVPFMNLMVVLIPLLLSSSEFVKIGMIELKLPESGASNDAGGGGGGGAESAKLDLGVVITSKGFRLFHYFKSDTNSGSNVDIPLKNGEYDFEQLNKMFADVKRKVLFELIKGVKSDLASDAELWQLYLIYSKNDLSSIAYFNDHENLKIVAEDKIKYQTVVAVMDAARGVSTSHGNVTMFPNVSIAGGILQ